MSPLDYPMYGYVEPPRTVHIEGYDFDHEVRVWLPPSYRHSHHDYPTLWVTDNALEAAMVALLGCAQGDAAELIVVAIGAPQHLPLTEFIRRRNFDFMPDASWVIASMRDYLPPESIGNASVFRDYLVDELRPALARDYRLAPDDHGLAGHSGGAMFGAYTLLTRPEAFGKYLLASPGAALDLAKLESAYAESHDDLPARVFIAAGGQELTDYHMVMAGVWSATTALADSLVRRGYPSLELTSSVLPGHSHYTTLPVAYIEGIRSLWSEHVVRPTKASVEAMMAAAMAEA